MMSSVTPSVLAGVSAFFVLHVLVWRARPSNAPRIFLLTGLALAGMMVSGWTSAAGNGWRAVEACATLWITGFCLTLYFFVYAGVARSVSVTLLARLRRSRTEPVALETLVNEYATSTRFHDRVQLMRRTGLLRVEGDRVHLTPRGRALSQCVRTLTRLSCGELRG